MGLWPSPAARFCRKVGAKKSSLRVTSGLPVVGVAEPHARGVDGAGGGCGGCGGGTAGAISWYTGCADEEEEEGPAAGAVVGLY